MSADDEYDGTVSLSRKLTEDESRELRITLLPYFTTETGVGVDDITDYLDYTFTMVSNSKDVTYVVKELEGLCSPEVSTKVGRELAAFIKKLNRDDSDNVGNNDSGFDEEGKRVISIKSSEEKGNALTMSGALGASREGGRTKKEKVDKGKSEKSEDKDDKRNKRGDSNRNDRRDNDRRDGDRKGGRGSRSVQGAAFERLSRGGDRGREDGPDRRRDNSGGRGRGDRDDGFDRRRDDRGGRGGRGHGGRGPRDIGGRGGRDEGRSVRGGRGDRMSGNRRSRDELDDEPDFVPADDRGGRGRGRGRGRGERDGPKRLRYDGGYDDGYGHDDYGGGYDFYDDGYGHQSYPPFRGGGRGGRGRFGGRGRGRGERGFEEHSGASNEAGKEGDNERQEKNYDKAGSENTDHPSPMVQASFGGRGAYAFRGRGFVRGGRGRGHGHFGGRAQVVSMIQSKTWVRKKEGDNEHGGGKGGEGES